MRSNRVDRPEPLSYVTCLLFLLIALSGVSACSATPGPKASDYNELVSDQQLEFCVIRHAEATKAATIKTANTKTAKAPDKPEELTPAGQEQARALAEALAPQRERTTRILTSPELRAQYTGDPIAKALGVEASTSGELAPLRGAITWEARVEGWKRGEDIRPDEGEAIRDGQWRARTLLLRLLQEEPGGKRVILITHQDISAVILGELEGTALMERPFKHALEMGQMACRAVAKDSTFRR